MLLAVLAAVVAWGCGGTPQANQAPTEDPAIGAADKAFIEAVGKGDAAALGNVLDASFEWIAANGHVYDNAATLQTMPKPALASETGADLTRLIYSNAVSTVTVNAGKNVELRVWAKRPQGWRLLIFQEVGLRDTPLGAQAAADCDNPCKNIPFDPKDDEQKGVVNAYKTMESAVVSGNASIWRDSVGYEFLGASSDLSAVLNKTAVAGDGIGLRAQDFNRQNLAALTPVPVTKVAMQDFPAVVIMRSRHQPAHGDPLEATRVWIMRNNIWIMTAEFETAVKAN